MPDPCPCCGKPLPHNGVFFDHIHGSVAVNGIVARGFTPKQLTFLEAVVRDIPRPVPRERIHLRMYGECQDGGPYEKIFDIYVCNVRKKLAAAKSHLHILTVRHGGYRAEIGVRPFVDRRSEKNTGSAKYEHAD